MEIPINQDIRKYKTKDIGSFSFAEAGWIVLGIGLGFITYKLTGEMEPAVIPIGIVMVIGFFKPFGMSFIQFLRTVVKELFSPRVYYCETDFVYDFDEYEGLYGDEAYVPQLDELIQSNPNRLSKEEKSLVIR